MAKIKVNQGDQFTRIVGVPSYGFDVAGANAYATVITTPNDGQTRSNLFVSCDTNNAIVSLNAGTTDHLPVLAGQPLLFEELLLSPNTAIQAKNMTAGANYANLVIVVS